MKNIIFFFSILFLTSIPAHAKIKKVKIKEDKSVHFTYNTDSCALKHKETKLILLEMYHFYNAVQNDDYQKYKTHLSPKTLELIQEEKLKRKFEKFKGQAVHLLNNISVRYIHLYSEKSKETSPIYTVVIKLPTGQSIARRMGFDALKRAKFDNIELHAGLHLVKHEDGFKVVILF